MFLTRFKQARKESALILLHGNTQDIYRAKNKKYYLLEQFLQKELKHDAWITIDMHCIDALQSIEDNKYRLYNPQETTIIYIKNAALLLPEGHALFQQEQQMLLQELVHVAQSHQVQQSKNTVILSTADKQSLFHSLLDMQNNIAQCQIKSPTRKYQEQFLKHLEAKYRAKKNYWYLHYDSSRDEILNVCQGLPLSSIHSAISLAAAQARALQRDDLQQMQKKQIQNISGNILELQDCSEKITDLYAIPHITNRLKEIAYLMQGKPQLCPKGLLFVGPPGTAKSVSARALANFAGINCLSLKEIRSKWVGESESNIQKVCDILDQFAPLILFIDEIDQASSSREGHEVDQRIFAQLLSVMALEKHRGKVLWIAASNRPDLIDPALKRSGRLEETIYFSRPDAKARQEILQAMLASHKLFIDLESLPQVPPQFSGADIKKAVIAALQLAYVTDTKCSHTQLQEVFKNYLPSANQQQLDRMDSLAIKEVSDRRYLSVTQLQKRRSLI